MRRDKQTNSPCLIKPTRFLCPATPTTLPRRRRWRRRSTHPRTLNLTASENSRDKAVLLSQAVRTLAHRAFPPPPSAVDTPAASRLVGALFFLSVDTKNVCRLLIACGINQAVRGERQRGWKSDRTREVGGVVRSPIGQQGARVSYITAFSSCTWGTDGGNNLPAGIKGPWS